MVPPHFNQQVVEFQPLDLNYPHPIPQNQIVNEMDGRQFTNIMMNPDIPQEDRLQLAGYAVGAMIQGARHFMARMEQIEEENASLRGRIERFEKNAEDSERIKPLRDEFIRKGSAEYGFVESMLLGAHGGSLVGLGAVTLTGFGNAILPCLGVPLCTALGSMYLMNKSDQNCRKKSFERYEQEYKNLHPEYTVNEAFEYAKQKITEDERKIAQDTSDHLDSVLRDS